MGINVLSLCDGISGGQQSLKVANVKVNNYFASEINDESIKVTMENFPHTVQLGDMEDLLRFDDNGKIIIGEKLKNLPKIDLLIGGTPCQGLSSANPNRENLKDIRSKLFYNYVAIRNWLIENNNNELKFFLENVRPDKKTLPLMNEAIGTEPIAINSELVSAQRRLRYYWTNINDGTILQPEPRNIKIKDVIYDNNYKQFKDDRIERTKRKTKNYFQYDLSGKGYKSQADRAYYLDGTFPTLCKAQPSNKANIWLGGDLYRRIHPIEGERAQGLPDNYTSIIKSDSKRLGLVGDGWNIPTIVHIFNYLPDEWFY